MSAAYWLLLFTGIILSSLGGILLKTGSTRINFDQNTQDIILGLFSNWRLFVGILFYFVPAVLWIYMLNKVDISFLQPLFALAYVLTPLLAVFLLQESISVLRWLGILTIILGVVLVARG